MIHILDHGQPLCDLGRPDTWPPGHKWVVLNEADLADCGTCLQKADICVSRHRGANTSVEAQRSTPAATRDTIRNSICEYIRSQGHYGATCETVEHAMSLSHQSASARCSELLRDGKIKILPGRSRTRSGRSCRIYYVPEDGK